MRERHSAGGERGVGRVDIGDFEVEDGGGLVRRGVSGRRLGRRGLSGCRLRRGPEHEANGAALKERHLSGVEEELHAEGVRVEIPGARQVAHGDGDLADLVEMNGEDGFHILLLLKLLARG